MVNQIIEIKQGSKRYPRLLAEIHDLPSTLYCRGNIELLNTHCFAVVGTRAATQYGKDAARHIVFRLASAGITVVSGLAFGIDAVAHQTTLDANGLTIAVLGSGIENITPMTNRHLAQDILDSGGLIISEYPGRTEAGKHTFPARNRIISGISHGTLVVEANLKSGALITASCALDQNRDVFAVPGAIFSPRSAGPNTLIKRGAKPVLDASDILEEYEIENWKLEIENSDKLSTVQDEIQKKILAILTNDGPTSTDELIRQSGINTQTVIATLSLLEIGGIIINSGNIYRIRT